MQLSATTENYLKAIYKLQNQAPVVTTNNIAYALGTTAPTAHDMIKKLAQGKLITHTKYRGVGLTTKGNKAALEIVRRHRLWEVFLSKTLGFKWDEVHAMAEQLEHVSAPALIDRIDQYLGYPKFDPHGDPIPSATGKIAKNVFKPLTQFAIGQAGTIAAVTIDDESFLKHLEKLSLTIGTNIKILAIHPFDKAVEIKPSRKPKATISVDIAKNLLIRKS